MPKPRIYVETSVISYLTARPSRDAIVASRQTMSHLWRESVDDDQLFISGLVLQEIAQGDTDAAGRRLRVAQHCICLPEPDGVEALALRLMQAQVVPSTEPEDAAHIALATLHQMDYLATWNFAHFVSPDAKYKVFLALSQWGYKPPLFATPEELYEGAHP
jgi:predicted nucleic acid-binding protein